MDKVEPFWMVWCETTSYTRVHHPTREAAINEAKRLAFQNKGQRFFVLAPIGAAVVRDPVEWSPIEHPDHIPF